MSESIRAFLAVDLPHSVRETLAGLADELREARIRGLRPVNPDGIHLTLKFLGDIPAAQAETIANATSNAVEGHRPFSVELAALGVFPNERRPRVMWVGVEGDLKSLADLHHDIDDAMAGLGFEKERRLFSPHLTVGRIREATSPADRSQALETLLGSRTYEPGRQIPVIEVSVIRSILRPEGARYERLAVMPLGGKRPCAPVRRAC